MKKEEFETWFYKCVDKHLFDSLENWQIERIKELCRKAINKGKK